MNAGPEDGIPIESLIVELRRLGDAVDKDDLSGLAKMHGACEALMRSAGADAAAGGSPLCELVHELGKTLEALILGEAADPDEAMSAMAEKVSALEKLAVSAPSADVEKPPVAELSDDEVSARLASVFEDEPSSDNPSATDESTTTASNKSAPSAATTEGECPVTGAFSGDNADAKPAAAAPPYESEPLSIKESETEFVKGFVEEAYEHIEAIEAALLDVEREPDDSAKIDSLFRPFHTIKGMAGFLIERGTSVTFSTPQVQDSCGFPDPFPENRPSPARLPAQISPPDLAGAQLVRRRRRPRRLLSPPIRLLSPSSTRSQIQGHHSDPAPRTPPPSSSRRLRTSAGVRHLRYTRVRMSRETGTRCEIASDPRHAKAHHVPLAASKWSMGERTRTRPGNSSSHIAPM
jgi:hypothetical protein